MNKVMFALWRPAGVSADDFRDTLCNELRGTLCENVQLSAVRLAVVDSAVDQASSKRLSTCQPLPDALISLWLEPGCDPREVQHCIEPVVGRLHGYRVSESEPLVNSMHVARPGERVFGFCQVVFLRRPEWLKKHDWLAVWQGSHTQIAIDTQSTFAYRQNVVEDSLEAQSPQFDAIVEESFPPQAMTSQMAFYGVDDEKALAVNRTAMAESCARFIDFQGIDVIPMSEYVLKTR
jgi:hypothetical protein